MERHAAGSSTSRIFPADPACDARDAISHQAELIVVVAEGGKKLLSRYVGRSGSFIDVRREGGP
jgi:hypothetical protein